MTHKAWVPRGLEHLSPDQIGYGKHEYRMIDPSTINPEDYARDMRGEQEHFGDIREYNSADNSPHPETTLLLDDACRPGTIFSTEAPGHEGTWQVRALPVLAPDGSFLIPVAGDHEAIPEEWIPAVDLGIVQDLNNLFKQVKSVLIERPVIGKANRERLTKKA